MQQKSPLWLVVNPASGSNDEDAVREVVEAFKTAGTAPARIIDITAGDLPELTTLESAGVGTLAIFTGDGTANAALSKIEGWTGQVLVLPGGTSNLLAKALHGECSAPDLAAALPTLAVTRRSCLRTSQGAALIEVLAGPGATWSDVREGMREGDLTEVATKAVEAIRASTTGPLVKVGEPELGRPEGYVGVRLVPEAGGMTVDGYGADGAADYARQAGALLRRNFREGPHDKLGSHAEVVCASLEDAPIELMVDGERRTGSPRERFSLAPFALDLFSRTG